MPTTNLREPIPMLHLWTIIATFLHARSTTKDSIKWPGADHRIPLHGVYEQHSPRINRESSFRKKNHLEYACADQKFLSCGCTYRWNPPPRAFIDVIYFFEGACVDLKKSFIMNARRPEVLLCAHARIGEPFRLRVSDPWKCAKWNTARTRIHHGQ